MIAPLTQVLQTVEDGVRTVPAIAETTGLDRDLVSAALDHLIRSGRLGGVTLAALCSPSTCGGCSLLSRGCRQVVR